MNYGETLAYWYLRLNGFFPLRNFVHHMPDDRDDRGDCDLVAVRFPHVSEEVGGAAGDFDEQRFALWGLPLPPPNTPVALIVQVKTGERADHGERAFGDARVKGALQRIGLWPAEVVTQLAHDLKRAAHTASDNARVGKLLIASHPCNHPAVHFTMSMNDAAKFIRARFDRYRDAKAADRLFFNDELIQFLASAEDNGGR
jgi:hypothetical protein